MSRPRQVPDDRTLTRIFKRHPGWVAQDFITHYGWPASRALVREHRRRIMSGNPIAGAASISRVEFRRRVEWEARTRHAAVTGVDYPSVTRIHSEIA
jgi:hypothetical protein